MCANKWVLFLFHCWKMYRRQWMPTALLNFITFRIDIGCLRLLCVSWHWISWTTIRFCHIPSTRNDEIGMKDIRTVLIIHFKRKFHFWVIFFFVGCRLFGFICFVPIGTHSFTLDRLFFVKISVGSALIDRQKSKEHGYMYKLSIQ